MAPRPRPPDPPPAINIEPGHFPQEVIDWYVFSESRRHNAELSLKAKKHLISLGWHFWYIDKKTKWELRYTSPTGTNYISLRKACKACIDQGGCGIPNTTFLVATPPPPTPPPTVSSSPEGARTEYGGSGPQSPTFTVQPPQISTAPMVSSSPEEEEEELLQNNSAAEQQICHQRVVEPEPEPEAPSAITFSSSPPKLIPKKVRKKRQGKPRRAKRRRKSDADDEWTPPTTASSSTCSDGKTGKALRSSKRVKKIDEAQRSNTLHRNPRTVLSWLIDNKVVLPEARVHCRGVNDVEKRGKLLRSGVACDCCGYVFTLTRFEAHANCTKHRPAASILLEDGRSLLDCQREALSNSQENIMIDDCMKGKGLKDQNDGICCVCQYGGDLLLCDRCPSSYHCSCVGLDAVPDGDWFCPPCCCKICKLPRFREDSADHVDNNLISCDQCERKYHIGCLRSRGITKFKNNPDEIWLCDGVCHNLFFSLQAMIGKPIPVEGGNLTWTILKTMKSIRYGDHDIVVLSQIQSKLSVALGVMQESFNPMIDPVSGEDIVPGVFFSRGARFKRLNFRGFYTVILEKNDEIISVANIRIFGNKVAEVPLVATRMVYRRLGMCRIMMDEIEKKLSQLGVERMVLPAAEYLINTWINSFGFSKVTASDRYHYLDYTFLDFQDTVLCHKTLKQPQMLCLAGQNNRHSC